MCEERQATRILNNTDTPTLRRMTVKMMVVDQGDMCQCVRDVRLRVSGNHLGANRGDTSSRGPGGRTPDKMRRARALESKKV